MCACICFCSFGDFFLRTKKISPQVKTMSYKLRHDIFDKAVFHTLETTIPFPRDLLCIMVAYVGHQEKLFSNDGAFACLLHDGSVQTWGSPAHGGDTLHISRILVRVNTIVSTRAAFAALREDGQIVTWGCRDSGGDCGALAEHVMRSGGAQEIHSAGCAFVAILKDMSVVCWGQITGIHPNVTDVVQLACTMRGSFAALTRAGDVVTWGCEFCDGQTYKVFHYPNVIGVFGHDTGFVMQLGDGRAVSWNSSCDGDTCCEDWVRVDGDILTSITKITNVKSVFLFETHDAVSRRLMTWWPFGCHTAIDQRSHDVQQAMAMSEEPFVIPLPNGHNQLRSFHDRGGYANILHGGETFVHNRDMLAIRRKNGDVEIISRKELPVRRRLSLAAGVTQLHANRHAVCAVLVNGAVRAWGEEFNGGQIPASIRHALVGGVECIESTVGAFAAKMVDGRVVTWGNWHYGARGAFKMFFEKK